jgi:AcrR family transcriptional regulator
MAILEALVARLERQTVEEISIDELAREAGVSRRTLYRYFPGREALLAAAEELIVARLGLPASIDYPSQISATFRESARRMDAHPGLARALRQTTTGSELRPPMRARRLAAIAAALEPLTRELDPAEARRVEAVIAFLCSANAFVSMQDESGLSGGEVAAAVSWAIDTLLADVQGRLPGRSAQ